MVNDISPQSKPLSPLSTQNSPVARSGCGATAADSTDNKNNNNNSRHQPAKNDIVHSRDCSSNGDFTTMKSGSNIIIKEYRSDNNNDRNVPIEQKVKAQQHDATVGQKRPLENGKLSEAKRKNMLTTNKSMASTQGAAPVVMVNNTGSIPNQNSPSSTDGTSPSTSKSATSNIDSLRLKIKCKKMSGSKQAAAEVSHEVLYKQQQQFHDPAISVDFKPTSSLSTGSFLPSTPTSSKMDSQKMDTTGHHAVKMKKGVPKLLLDRKPLRTLDNDNSSSIKLPISNVDFMDNEEKLDRYRDAGTWVRTIGGTIEPECLGPCEAGTAVTLEGIVWNETSSGVLVVNVTWRGKSYVGTLLDCSKSEWSAPRLCESPNVHDTVNCSGGKGRNLKRNHSHGHNLTLNLHTCTKNGSIDSPSSAAKKFGAQNTAGGIEEVSSAAVGTPTTATAAEPGTPSSSMGVAILEPSSPLLIECPSWNCHKKFDNLVALKYHQSSIHRAFSRSRADAATWTHAEISLHDIGINTTIMENEQNSTLAGKLNNIGSANIDGYKKSLTEIENASLDSLFNVVGPPKGAKSPPPPLTLDVNSAGQAPDLGPPKTNLVPMGGKVNCNLGAGSSAERLPSPAFSDVSDAEEAPTLERHLSPLAEQNKSGPIVNNNDEPEKRPHVMTSQQQQHVSAKVQNLDRKVYEPLKPSSVVLIKPEPLPSPLPPPMGVIDRPSPQRLPPSFAPQPFTAPYVPYNSGAPCRPTLMPPMLPFDPATLIYTASGPMFQPPFASPAPMVSSYGAHIVGPPTAFYAPAPMTPLPMSAPPPPVTCLPSPHHHHKIHQLTADARSERTSSASSPSARKDHKMMIASPDGSKNLANNNQSPKGAVSDSSLDGSRSPPVQRHHHLHHHTHSYPGLMTPADSYAAMLASQQAAAAAGMVGPYPPFVPK